MSLLSFRPNSSSAAFGSDRSAAKSGRFQATDIPPSETSLVFAPTPECHLLVEALCPEGAALHREAWADLVSRSLEPNVFLEPSFALTAAQHFAPAQRPIFIMVWALQASGGRDLLAVCPLIRSHHPLRRKVAVWFHDLSTLGAPLLDRQYAAVAVQAVLAWIARRLPGCGALLLHAIPAEGPTAQVLGAVAHSTGRRIHLLDRRQRAALRTGQGRERSGLGAVSRKRAKELGRQHRRLAEHGDVQYRSARGGQDLRDAVEHFLLLEAKGWKGAQGTALLMDASRATFARTMTRLLAREGKCRVDSLTLNGVPVASGILLSSGGQDFFWKMAYAEEFASLSPGVQFVLGLTEAQRLNPGVDVTDSCAVPDHPMIDRLWLDRLAVVDTLVAVMPGASARFGGIVAGELRRRRTKAWVKRMVGGLRAMRDRRRSRDSG